MQPESDPDTDWVAALAGVDRRAAALALGQAAEESRLFHHIEREHRRAGRPSYIEIDAPLELYALVRLMHPRHVVEVGVSSGVSSAYLLQGLARNGSGTLHSVDRPKREPAGARDGRRALSASWALPPGRSSGWAVPDSLRGRWDLRIGDKKEVLPLLAEELPRIDLFVYDVPHEDQAARREFFGLDSRMPKGGVAIADHGPGGELCSALQAWAAARKGSPRGRSGLGLYGFRCASPASRSAPH
jgi:Methyltransferase domain